VDYPQAADEHYALQAGIAVTAIVAARRLWARLGIGDDFDVVWQTLGPQLFLILASAQQAAAVDGTAFVGKVLGELNIDAPAEASLIPAALVGVASSGLPLQSLLYQSVISTKVALGNGAPPARALQAGLFTVETIFQTQVADAGRAAVSVSMASRPRVNHYVRMLNTPSCPRCVVLAGKLFPWNAGFSRHPKCDCRGIPISEDVAGDFRTDARAAVAAGQVRGLSKADTKAIVEDGANVSRVINAHNGMATEQVFGRKLKVTYAKITRRKGAAPLRLRPDAIYKLATGRADAIRLLKEYGYVT
jgi:hypothetical protein